MANSAIDPLDLSDEEIKDIVNSLRDTERHSRKSFSLWLANHLDDESGEALAKVNRAKAAFVRLVGLRAKFGDTKPVEVKFQ